jgi:hypothetical protein
VVQVVWVCNFLHHLEIQYQLLVLLDQLLRHLVVLILPVNIGLLAVVVELLIQLEVQEVLVEQVEEVPVVQDLMVVME